MATINAGGIEKEAYFDAYIKNATNSAATISTISQIPENIPLETLVAITTYKPQTISGTVLQNYGQNTQIIQNSIAARLEQSGLNRDRLANYTPRVAGNAIQRRRNIDGRRINGILRGRTARETLLAGLDPKTRKLVEDLEDLKKLQELQAKLDRWVKYIEGQINKFTGIFNALINGPLAAATAAVDVVFNRIVALETLYNTAKALFELAKKIYYNTKRAILKAIFEDYPKAKRTFFKAIDVFRKILKLPELKLKIRFPKFPKLPRLTPTKTDFIKKFKKLLQNLMKKDGEFNQKAYDMAVQQAGFEFEDPKKDKLQRGFIRAKNALRAARVELLAKQAIVQNKVNKGRDRLIDNVRKTTDVTNRERNRLLEQYDKAKKKASKIDKLKESVSARRYLNAQELREIVPSSRVDITRKNGLGDLPATLPDRPGAQLPAPTQAITQRVPLSSLLQPISPPTSVAVPLPAATPAPAPVPAPRPVSVPAPQPAPSRIIPPVPPAQADNTRVVLPSTSSSTQSSSRLTQINSRITEINRRRTEIDRQADQIDRILMTSTDQATYDRLNPALQRLDAEDISLGRELGLLNREKSELSR